MGKNGNLYSATVPSAITDGLFVAQDEYFNTKRTAPLNAPAIHVDPGFLANETDCRLRLPPDHIVLRNAGVSVMDYVVEVDADWLDVEDVTSGEITDEPVLITIIYAVEGLNAGLYQANITITSASAANSPQVIPVTVRINHVSSDLDNDCDVDQSDFGKFQTCLTGSGIPLDGEQCTDADLDGDNDVDQDDLIILTGCMSGADYLPTCSD